MTKELKSHGALKAFLLAMVFDLKSVRTVAWLVSFITRL